LIEALSRGDRPRAAELLVSEHAAAIGRVCLALLGSQAESEEALQETLLSALASGHTFRGDGSLRAWLLTIARRQCARQIELRSREQAARQRLASDNASGTPDSSDGGAEGSVLRRHARELLTRLRPTEREALVLHYAGGLNFREVALACGIDEAAARKRASRGLLRLRELLSEKGR
jgi:RNA polymerase sigma-70 factor (ECF subfamily)